MSLIYLYPIFFAFLMYKEKEKTNHAIYVAMLIIFFAASLCAVWLVETGLNSGRLSLIAIVYHLFALFIIMRSFRGVEAFRECQIAHSPAKIIYPFTAFIIIISLIYIVKNIQNVSLGAIQYDVLSLRHELVEHEGESNTLLRYINYFAKSYDVVALVLAFYYMKFAPNKKLLILLLLLCSMSHTILSLQFAGREYIIKYVFVFTCVLYILSNNIPANWSRFIRIFLITIGSIAVFLFLFITLLRFSNGGATAVQDSMVSYLGQGLVNFSETFTEFPYGVFDKKGTMYFSFFAGSITSGYNLNDIVNTSVSLNSFSTSVGSLIQDCGILWTTIILLIFAFLFHKVRCLSYFNVFTMIYIAFICQILFSMPFFFNSNFTGTQILSILIVILLDVYSRRS